MKALKRKLGLRRDGVLQYSRMFDGPEDRQGGHIYFESWRRHLRSWTYCEILRLQETKRIFLNLIAFQKSKPSIRVLIDISPPTG